MDTTVNSVGKFRFGRYTKYGMSTEISKCNDIDYLIWYYQTHDKRITEDDYKCILRTIQLQEPSLTEYNGKIIPREEKRRFESVKNNIDVFKKMNLAKITFQKNPDCNGYIDHYGMKLKFENVRYHTYNGWQYFLPDMDGKSIRIKNKLFKVFAIPKETDDGTVFHIKKLTRLKS